MPRKTRLPSREEALPGRSEAVVVSANHAVNRNPMYPPFPEGMQMAMFGMGCFWGAERKFWQLSGVFSTQVGFSGGFTPNPTYKEVCTAIPGDFLDQTVDFSYQIQMPFEFIPKYTQEEIVPDIGKKREGMTGHTEVVRIVFDPQTISYEDLLKVFWESHDPTHGMKQHNDIGTQYRSAVYAFGTEQLESALRSKAVYEQVLARKQLGPITTEIQQAGTFYYAEDYHQQYLHKMPNGYCGLRGTGIACPIADGEET